MNKTNIEWALNPDGTPGYTWNPITGCLNGCEYCYARKLANGRLRSGYLANNNTAPLPDAPRKVSWDNLMTGGKYDPFYPRFWPEKLDELTKRNDYLWADDIARGKKKPSNVLQMIEPKGIFVCSMSDLFGIGVPQEWTEKVMDEIWGNKGVDLFYLLTKQPQNLIKFSPFPDNAWVGVSATNETMFYEACYKLKDIRAKVKYISLEPLLRFDTLKVVLDKVNWITNWLMSGGIGLVIIGGQTNPTKLPEYEWVVEIVRACDKAGIPVFLKNNLNTCSISDFPELLDKQGNMRQEMPEVK